MRRILALATILLCAVEAQACSADSGSRDGASEVARRREALVLPDQLETNPAWYTTETATAYVRGYNRFTKSYFDIFVAGYNTHVTGGFGWSRMDSTGSLYSAHTTTDSGFAWLPPSDPPTDGSTWPANGYNGDPAVVWTGYNNGVAFFGLIDSRSTGNVDVFGITSNDAGMTFRNSRRISDALSGQRVDSPTASRDYSAPVGEVWVHWRQWNAPQSWVRKITYDSAGNIVAWTPARPVPVGALNALAGKIAVGDAANNGGKSRIGIAFSTDPAGQLYHSCGDVGVTTTEVKWYFIASNDEGVTWSSPILLDDDTSWPFCLSGQASPSYTNRWHPQLAFDSEVRKFVVAWTRSAPWGTTLKAAYSDNPTPTTFVPMPIPCWVNINGAQGCPAPPNTYLFGPALATAPPNNGQEISRVALSFYQNVQGNPLQTKVAYVMSKDFGVSWPDGAFLSSSSFPLSCPWIDYDNMSANPTDSSFLRMWADERAGSNCAGGTNVWGAVFQ